jgi:ferrous iron transport protein B
LLGFTAAVATARLLKSSILKSQRTPFILEMPPYRRPTLRGIALRLVDRAVAFLRRAGTVILAVAVALWFLAHLPLYNGQAPPIEQSLAGTIGRTVEPLIKPLGFNWKIGIGLITSLAAREVIVGTLGAIYGMEGDARSTSLQKALQSDLSPASAVALLIFFAFAMQCMSTIAVVRRETGGWKWPILQFTYMGALAWTCAFAAYRVVQAIV